MKPADVHNYRLGLESLVDSELRERLKTHSTERDRLVKAISKAQSLLAIENRLLKHVERERAKRKRENHVVR